MARLAERGEDKTTTDSTVVLLSNVVPPGAVDAALEAEMRDECSKHGTVRKVRILFR